MHQNLRATTDFINKKTSNFEPEIGIVLGTGLGGLVEDIEIHHSLMYANIPDFPISTLEFHSGKLIFGMLGGKRVVAMQGRLHYYEGYDMKQITFPVRVMKMLGIQKLFISNASGALNPEYRKGDLMIINDHINMQSDNPLRGKNTDSLGPRFPDMSEPYDRKMIEMGMQIALKNNIRCHSGVYVSVNGPNLETRSEYRFLRLIGADSVGMSTVPEVIVANHMSLPVFAISVLTDEGFPDTLKAVSLEEILKTAEEAEPKMTKILKELILEL
jgi:purine-nucleoside phosphorylase